LGLFLSKSATSSLALGGAFTLPSRTISFAVSFCPYSFSLALPSERSVEPSRGIKTASLGQTLQNLGIDKKKAKEEIKKAEKEAKDASHES